MIMRYNGRRKSVIYQPTHSSKSTLPSLVPAPFLSRSHLLALKCSLISFLRVESLPKAHFDVELAIDHKISQREIELPPPSAISTNPANIAPVRQIKVCSHAPNLLWIWAKKCSDSEIDLPPNFQGPRLQRLLPIHLHACPPRPQRNLSRSQMQLLFNLLALGFPLPKSSRSLSPNLSNA